MENQDNNNYNKIHKYDVTSIFYNVDNADKETKVAFSNKVDFVDLSEIVNLNLYTKLKLQLGSDVPPYLTLKKLEKDILGVDLLIKDDGSRLLTVIAVFRCRDYTINVCNITDKFFLR